MSTTLEATKPEHTVVTRSQWLADRQSLLNREKQQTHLRDELAELRRQLPWVRVEKPYAFQTSCGTCALPDLFGNQSQLLVYHFMFAPDWQEGCPGCSMVADHLNGISSHISQRDISLMLVSRASVEKIDAFKKRMGWNLNWVSSGSSDFNSDFGVTFTEEQLASGKVYNFGTQAFPMAEAPGLSAFAQRNDEVFHTYSTYGRGVEELLGVYSLLDLAPDGRNEAGLKPPMAWVRHHDKYPRPTTPSMAKASCGCH